jgi:hypothetical protein
LIDCRVAKDATLPPNSTILGTRKHWRYARCAASYFCRDISSSKTVLAAAQRLYLRMGTRVITARRGTKVIV